jgi:hypothetical protein
MAESAPNGQLSSAICCRLFLLLLKLLLVVWAANLHSLINLMVAVQNRHYLVESAFFLYNDRSQIAQLHYLTK